MMKFFKQMRRHAAMAGRNFDAIFKDVEIPPLPVAVQRIIVEINKNHPDLDELGKLISSTTDIAAKVIKTVNSSYYSPRTPITEIKQAVMFLGLKKIRSLVMAYAVMDAAPRPDREIFDHEAFWIDSLLRAFFSRNFAETWRKGKGDEAFTASLIADVAIPVFLSAWGDYYEPICRQWQNGPDRLSTIERAHFGWDHAQAGAWVVQSWGFPDELVCYIGAHNLTIPEIETLALEDTIVVPMAVAALSESILRQDDKRRLRLYETAVRVFDLSQDQWIALIDTIRTGFSEMLSLFGLSNGRATDSLDRLICHAQADGQECRA